MATHILRRVLGMGGVPPGDNARAHSWERRLHGVMIAIALASVASVYCTELSDEAGLRVVGRVLEWGIFVAFGAELAWMLHVSSEKLRYLFNNWLDVLIVLFAGLALAGADTEWVALARLLRLATVAMLLTRASAPLRGLFSPGGLPYVFGLAMVAFLAAGAGFYWLEPTVHSYAEGLWLAFVTGATVGYGDIVPTNTAARLFAVLIVLVGLTMFSLVTASLAAFFVGEDEKLLRRQTHRDIQHVKQDMARLIGDEEAQVRRELHADIRRLREEVTRLREELRRQGLIREE
ncbi:MAG TPA: ion channel [Burkholderiales bacterium]|nr:ion channel [Burkholderiales bacterium]